MVDSLATIRKSATEFAADQAAKQTSQLTELERVAWLSAAGRPNNEVYQAIGNAKQAGSSWREIAAAKGREPSESEARKTANSYAMWKKAQQ